MAVIRRVSTFSFDSRQAPSAKHRHHHRIFLRQQRHRQRDTGQQLQPVATQQAVDADQYQTQANPPGSARLRTSAVVCICSGERSTASVASEVPMRPMALRGPVAVTRAIPAPARWGAR